MVKKSAVFLVRYMVSLLCCAYVHTAGALFRLGRKRIRTINSVFGFTLLDTNPDPLNLVPEITLADLCPEDRLIRCMKPEFESGGIFPFEMICMNVIVAHFSPERVFEIGTFNGRTALNIAANTLPHTRIFTLDLPFGKSPSTTLRQHPWDARFIETRGNGRYYRESSFRDKITQLNGDSATFDFTPYAGTALIRICDQ
jgi:hypothetical protein